MTPVRRLLCTLGSAAVSLSLASHAAAQTVDYTDLGTLFGESVTTSATGKPQKVSDAPVGIDIINQDQIRRLGVTSLPEVLDRLPGVSSWQGTRSFADVGVRGMISPANATLLVLVNGRQVYADSSGFTDWALIPVQLEEIVQIEVVKGPATALYGFNAASGVINIITANPQYDAVNHASITAGTGAYRNVQAAATVPFSDSVHLRLSASDESFNEFGKNSKTSFVARSQFRDAVARKFSADGLIQIDDKTQLRLENSYVSAAGSDVISTYNARQADKSFMASKASLSSETSIGLVEANLYMNTYNKALTNTVGPETHVRNQTTVLQVQDLFKTDAENTFRIEAEYRHNALESALLIAPGAEVYYDLYSVGGMWNWAITPEIEWTNALRVDTLKLGREGPFTAPTFYTSNSQFDEDMVAVGANSGITWKATEEDTFRASWGRGIQSPSLFEYGTNFATGGPVVLIGNPKLGPTIVNNYEIGYDRHIDMIDGKFRGSVFYRDTQDVQTTGGSSFIQGGNVFLQADDVGNSRTVGFEFGLNGTIDTKWTWDTSYIYQQTDDSLTPSASATPSNEPIHYQDTVPDHILKAHLGYASGPWEADLYGEAGSSFHAMSSNGGTYSELQMDGYATLGGRVAYTFDEGVTLAVMGSNLQQTRTADNYGLENDRTVLVSLSKKF